MKAIDKLREITTCLKSNAIESAEKEAEILVKQGLNITTVDIYRDNPVLDKEQIMTVESMLERRLRREPFQYILGYEEFMGLRLVVGPGVLIPRPETEFMAEQAIKTVKSYKLQVTSENKDSSLSILDLCTGTGCLALAVAKEFPAFHVYGTDISEVAIEYAKKNAELNRIKNAVFLKGSFFQPVDEIFSVDCLPLAFDLIISNPPYIKTEDIMGLQPEVKDWEPLIALDGGAGGFDFYRESIPAARHYLKEGGLIMFELGHGQSGTVADIIESSGYSQIKIIKDYSGIERVIQARWKS